MWYNFEFNLSGAHGVLEKDSFHNVLCIIGLFIDLFVSNGTVLVVLNDTLANVKLSF